MKTLRVLPGFYFPVSYHFIRAVGSNTSNKTATTKSKHESSLPS